MMRTVEPAVDPRAARRRSVARHARVHRRHERLVEQPQADAALVGHDDDQEARRDSAAGSRRSSTETSAVLEPAQVADVVDHRAVAIEKHRWTHAISHRGVERGDGREDASTVMRFMQR